MYSRIAKIAEKNNIILKIMKLPTKVRAFILELENNIYVVINESLSDTEKEKAFQTRTFTL